MSFGSLLIANRGEISVRIIRACRELDIKSIAVYSEADETSMHRRMADKSHLLGPAPASESYLNVDRVVEAIEASGAEAVHPGYGFLSESAAFARAVEGAGAVWVGPSPEAMQAVGDKVRAKALARRADVPTVPGYDGEDQSEAKLVEEAGRIGFPMLVKASAGGGGRGMRVVGRREDFVEAVRSARREAEAAFGDSTVFLEKLVEVARHVEVQILGDKSGDVVHLYERECSIQRRHQKVVEEAPSPALDDALRERICAAAVRLAREANYHNAGTVEFLLSGEEFYFLEMNARLQVEHPVTELVTGLDLVHLQLTIAAGEPLPFTQDDIAVRGSAIETRLYAEDDKGMPSGGRLRGFSPPDGPGVRNDTGFEAGDEVPVNYDAMLAKLIVHASNRPAAVRRLRRALADYRVLGVPTNIPLLKRIAAHPAFESGETGINFLEEHHLTDAPPLSPIPREALLLAAAAEIWPNPTSTEPFEVGSWRMIGAATARFHAGHEEHRVDVERGPSGALRLSVEGEESVVEVLHVGDGCIRALVDGKPVDAGLSPAPSEVLVSLAGETYALHRPPPPTVEAAGSGGDAAASLTAPMPGTVIQVLVEEGDEVGEGQLLLVLEAMKMEQPVTAPHAGVVRSLPFVEGTLVPGGAVLAEIEKG